MLRIMIVDDMPVFREFLRSAIDWKAYGFEVCCEAKNGKEAMVLAKEYDPDIVLSDITMPYVDGLELAETLNKSHPETAVVLITGNSEFEYARKAVKLGVADYIVKPFEKEELILTLLSLQDNINRALEEQEEKERLLSVQRDDVLRQLIYNKNPQLKIENLNLEGMDIACLNTYDGYYVASIELDGDLTNPNTSEDIMNWKGHLVNIIKSSIEIEGQVLVFTDYESRIIQILCVDNPSGIDFEDFQDMIALMKERIGYDISIGVGSYQTNISGLRTSYVEAIGALNYRHEVGKNKVIHFKKTSNESKSFGFYSAEVNEKLLDALSQGSKEHTQDLLESVFVEADKKAYSKMYRYMVNMGLLSLLMSYIVKSGKNVSDIFPKGFDPNRAIGMDLSTKDQNTFVKDVYRTVMEYIQTHKVSRASQIASQAKAYIDSNYNHADLSISDLSKALLVNQTYLRKMFKSEMHMTVSDYITKARMDASKKLISSKDYKLAFVAEAVGYSDPGYFSKCFKKYYGISPSLYRENSKG